MIGRDCSLHVGTNFDRSDKEGPDSGISIARSLAEQAAARGLITRTLTGPNATASNVLQEIRAAANTLQRGDLFLLTYVGHGGYRPDTSGDEPDKQDETWDLPGGALIDDQLYLAWLDFAPGVEVRVIADCCFSETSVRLLDAPAPDSGALLMGGYIKALLMPPDAIPAGAAPLQCSVYTTAAASDDSEGNFGVVSTKVVAVLDEWLKQGYRGTWAEMRARMRRLGIPREYVLKGAGHTADMEVSAAFYPRS